MFRAARYRPDAGREDLVFTNNRGGHILRGNFTRDALRPAVIRAGLNGQRVTWLTLRHTAASLMFDAGLTLFEVQQRLGHKNPTLTANIYTHLMRERFDEGRGKLETYMRDNRKTPPQPPRRAPTVSAVDEHSSIGRLNQSGHSSAQPEHGRQPAEDPAPAAERHRRGQPRAS